MKKITSILVFALLLVAIPIAVVYNNQQKEIRSHASPATILSFNPSSPAQKANDTFTLDVMVNTGSNTISASKLVINADGEKVKITGITAGSFLTNTLIDPVYTDTRASITLGSPPASPKQGTGTLATVSFQVVGTSGISQITFTGSQIAGISEDTNVLSQSVPATITIVESVNPTATPTQIITTTPVPTATPTPVDSSGNPTATPTQATQHSPTPTSTAGSDDGTGGGDSSGYAPLPVTGAFEPKVIIPIVTAIASILIGLAL